MTQFFSLQNFSNEALEKRQLEGWDLVRFVSIARSKMIDSSHKEDIAKIIQGFEQTVELKLPLLKRSIIHFDATELNIIVSKNQCDGYDFNSFIDFGDVIESYTIIDLAVCLSSPMVHQVGLCANVVEFVGPLICGYNSVLPLSTAELECLYYLVLGRCCLLALNCEVFYRAEPWNEYIQVKIDKNWNLVQHLLQFSEEEVIRTWKSFIYSNSERD